MEKILTSPRHVGPSMRSIAGSQARPAAGERPFHVLSIRRPCTFEARTRMAAETETRIAADKLQGPTLTSRCREPRSAGRVLARASLLGTLASCLSCATLSVESTGVCGTVH
jgi:hypothetical protein